MKVYSNSRFLPMVLPLEKFKTLTVKDIGVNRFIENYINRFIEV